MEALEQLAAEAPVSGKSRELATHQGASHFDIDSWLVQSGLEIIKGPESYKGGRRWTLRSCPFNSEHEKPVVLELGSGALVYRCLHRSCAENDWHALRHHIEPHYRKWSSRPATNEPPPPSGVIHRMLRNIRRLAAPATDLGRAAPSRSLLRRHAPRLVSSFGEGCDQSDVGANGFPCRRCRSVPFWCREPASHDPTEGSRHGLESDSQPLGGIIGRPGFMKSPSIDAITKPLKALQAECFQDFEQRKLEYEMNHERNDLELTVWKEQYKSAAKNGGVKPDRPQEASKPPDCRRLIVMDATFEALHQAMNQNPEGVLVLRDELTGWLAQLDKPGSVGERAFCLEAWSGDSSFTRDRIGRGTVHVEHCCMSLLGSIQPGRLRSYLADALRDGPGDDGLIQRVLLVRLRKEPPGYFLEK
jgi:hypothetical protein